MRQGAIATGLLAACALAAAAPGSAGAAGRWGDSSAMPKAKGHWEAGLFSPLRFGLSEDVEISAQPLLMLVMPHLDAKVLWYAGDRFYFSMLYGLSYPTYFLELISREGAGGLLPKDTDVPQALMASTHFVGTLDLGDEHLLTAIAGTTVAPTFTSGDKMPLLDFPFLYARFAALKAVATYKLGLNFNGRRKWLAYALDLEAYLLPVIEHGYTVEQGGWLGVLAGDHFTFRLGYRLTYGRYPAGDLFNYFPFFDILIGG